MDALEITPYRRRSWTDPYEVALGLGLTFRFYCQDLVTESEHGSGSSPHHLGSRAVSRGCLNRQTTQDQDSGNRQRFAFEEHFLRSAVAHHVRPRCWRTCARTNWSHHGQPGDNFYTSSVVMLDARTGALRGFHQLVKNEFHDWDLSASPILLTSQAGRKMVAAAGKNGSLSGLDRGELASAGGRSSRSADRNQTHLDHI